MRGWGGDGRGPGVGHGDHWDAEVVSQLHGIDDLRSVGAERHRQQHVICRHASDVVDGETDRRDGVDVVDGHSGDVGEVLGQRSSGSDSKHVRAMGALDEIGRCLQVVDVDLVEERLDVGER